MLSPTTADLYSHFQNLWSKVTSHSNEEIGVFVAMVVIGLAVTTFVGYLKVLAISWASKVAWRATKSTARFTWNLLPPYRSAYYKDLMLAFDDERFWDKDKKELGCGELLIKTDSTTPYYVQSANISFLNGQKEDAYKYLPNNEKTLFTKKVRKVIDQIEGAIREDMRRRIGYRVSTRQSISSDNPNRRPTCQTRNQAPFIAFTDNLPQG